MTHTSPKRILILDDDEMRNMLELLLTAEGHSVTSAANSAEAVLLHRKNPFDLAIVELFMSDSNGLEAFVRLKRDPTPPKFIITAKLIRVPTEDYLKVAIQLGAHATLVKPFTAEQLLATTKNVLEGNV